MRKHGRKAMMRKHLTEHAIARGQAEFLIKNKPVRALHLYQTSAGRTLALSAFLELIEAARRS